MTINVKGGKEGFREWMMNPDKHSIEIGYVKHHVEDIAQQKKMVPPEYDSHQEIAKLKTRPDFEYGKDYSYLYSDKALPMFEKSKAQGR